MTLQDIPTSQLPALLETMDRRGFGVRASMVASEIRRRCNLPEFDNTVKTPNHWAGK